MKHWVKDVVVDLLVLILIIVLAFTSLNALTYVLWAYTALLLIGKIIYFFVPFLQQKANNSNVPSWFYHLIYLSACILLFVFGSTYLSLAWIVIWGLSIIAEIRQRKKKAPIG